MQTTIRVGIVAWAMLSWPASSVASEPDAADILALAEDAGRWIALQAPANEQSSLGSGIAGEVLFFSTLYDATRDTDYLKYAEQRGNSLLLTLQDSAQFDDDERRASLYSGVSGLGVALMQLDNISDDPRYAEGVDRVLELLERWRVDDDNGSHWSGKFNDLLYGDTGTVLFLADVAKARSDEGLAALAKEGARFLVSQARCDRQGCHWLFRRDKEFNLPNLSHGTAGVAYTLATVAELTDDEVLRRYARDGFRYIRSISDTDNDRIVIPYGWGADNWVGLNEFGWAHGLAGTALLFERLAQTGIEVERACKMMGQVRETLLSIGLPGVPAEPFAEPSTPLDFRFGRAGVLSLFSELAMKQPQGSKTSQLRNALLQHITSAAVRDAHFAYWEVEAPAFMGGGRQRYTGLLHGAAGIGLVLLRARANLLGEAFSSGLPDDPFRTKGLRCTK